MTRDPNPYLAFGVRRAFLLGAALARLEGQVLFEELADRTGTDKETLFSGDW
jgi:hypothetical protein